MNWNLNVRLKNSLGENSSCAVKKSRKFLRTFDSYRVERYGTHKKSLSLKLIYKKKNLSTLHYNDLN